MVWRMILKIVINLNINKKKMFQSSRKRKDNNFNDELELQLNNLQEQNHIFGKSSRKTYLNQLLDEAVLELSSQKSETDPQNKDHKLNPQLKANSKRSHQIQEISKLNLNQISQVQVYSKIEPISNHQEQPFIQFDQKICESFDNQELTTFFKDNFSKTTKKQTITIRLFAKKLYTSIFSNQYFQNENQISAFQYLLCKDLTTTNSEILSINALEILVKKITLKKYLFKQILKIKENQKNKQLEENYKNKLEDINSQVQQIGKIQQLLKGKQQQLKKRQQIIIQKEKILLQKQKQLLVKQSETKKHLQEKAGKLFQSYTESLEQVCKKIDKKMNHSERNMKYKIQILEKKALQLKILKNTEQDSNQKKILEDNQNKIKLRKAQKQTENILKQYKQDKQKFQNEEKQFMKTVSILEQKYNKTEKKNKKLKQKILELEEQLKQIQNNKQLLLKQYQLLKCVEQKENTQKLGLNLEQNNNRKNKQGTNRSTKNKEKQKIMNYKFEMNNLLNLLQNLDPIFDLFQNKISNLSEKDYKQMFSNFELTKLLKLYFNMTQFQIQRSGSSAQLTSNVSLNHLRCLFIKIIALKYSTTKTKKISAILEDQENYNTDSSKNYFEKIQNLVQQQTSACKMPDIQNKIQILQILMIRDLKFEKMHTLFEQFVQWIINQHHSSKNSQKQLLEQQFIIKELFHQKQIILFFIDKIFIKFIENIHEAQQIQVLKMLFQNSIGLIDILIHFSRSNPQIFLKKIIFNHAHLTILESFIDLMEIYLHIYNCSQVKKEKENNRNKNKKELFENINLMEELLEKLSILLQRLFYWNKEISCENIHSKKLNKYYELLSELNEGGQNKFELLLANTKHILA